MLLISLLLQGLITVVHLIGIPATWANDRNAIIIPTGYQWGGQLKDTHLLPLPRCQELSGASGRCHQFPGERHGFTQLYFQNYLQGLQSLHMERRSVWVLTWNSTFLGQVTGGKSLRRKYFLTERGEGEDTGVQQLSLFPEKSVSVYRLFITISLRGKPLEGWGSKVNKWLRPKLTEKEGGASIYKGPGNGSSLYRMKAELSTSRG